MPQIQHEWFIPFLEHAIANPSLDPWTDYLEAGGTPLAYPYGPTILLAHLPGALPGWLLDAITGNDVFTGIGFRISLLLADLAALSLLYRLFPRDPRKLLWLYWWSPIVLFVAVHVLMVLVSSPLNSLRSMITGRFAIRQGEG